MDCGERVSLRRRRENDLGARLAEQVEFWSGLIDKYPMSYLQAGVSDPLPQFIRQGTEFLDPLHLVVHGGNVGLTNLADIRAWTTWSEHLLTHTVQRIQQSPPTS
jgi:hypothetical protein